MQSDNRDIEAAARARLDHERTSVAGEFSPAQPTGPDRIHDDDHQLDAVSDEPPAHTKSDHAHRMKH
jgi:hypothetical protein